MDGTQVNAARWLFLCDNWNRRIDGQPFPVWLERREHNDFIGRVDLARLELGTRSYTPLSVQVAVTETTSPPSERP